MEGMGEIYAWVAVVTVRGRAFQCYSSVTGSRSRVTRKP